MTAKDPPLPPSGGVACQTMVFGRRPDPPAMLEAIARAGYDGVELHQPPVLLGPPEALRRMLERVGLRPVMITGQGPIEDRIRFAKAVGIPWIYTKGRDLGRIAEVEAAGLRFALHPHLNAPVERASQAAEVLRRFPSVGFAPDLAHLSVAGDDPEDVLREFAERIVIVHLKDWRPGWGRNRLTSRYGFRAPGRGVLPLERWLAVLREIGYGGWITIEIDRPPRRETPEQAIGRARRWLRERGW